MTIKFNKPFFASSLLLFSVEVCIAVFLSEGFIRHTFGDFLVVILMYCAIKSFIKVKPLKIAIAVLAFAFLIEFLQWFNLLDYLNLRQSSLAVIILGSTFEITDLIAYTLGVITIYLIDTKISISWKP
ncbi:DUF2809 domain-containing protein [Psychroserpens sp. SPM9]|uniref:ribosomal maturation YjgA family protein n=1 Tax=Psychroserpens sp. SPM9 TaxID=2975598 RepID=UPI0021A3B13B|nr:DUF2809 domain-containing protein [Psychroserpens sp. SPM9]MDG5492671.1 DUF2809 domain-containing protein [Psychroserpens sp. SPM9]